MKSAFHWLLVTVFLVTGCAKEESKTSSTDPASGGVPDGALDVTYITDDFTSAVVVHPARVLNSPFIKALIDAGVPIEKELSGFTEKTGVDPRNVSQVIVLLDNNTAEMAPMLLPMPGMGPPGGEFDEPFEEDVLGIEKEPLEDAEPATPEAAEPESGESDNAAITIDSDGLQPVNTVVQDNVETFNEGFPEDGPHGGMDRQGPPVPTLIVRFIEAVDQDDLFSHVKIPLEDGEVDGLKVKKGQGAVAHFVDEKTMIFAPEKMLKKVVAAKDVESPLTKRLKAADSKHDLIVVADLKPFANELTKGTGFLMLGLGDQPEIASIAPLLSKLKSVTLGVGLGSEHVLALGLELDSADSAKQGSESFAKLLKSSRPKYEESKAMFSGELDFENPAANEKVVAIVDGVVNGVAASTEGATLKLTVPQLEDLEGLVALLKPEIEKAQAAAENAKKMNNLRQIGLAFHNYHDLNGAFPGAGSDGEALQQGLSWRVHLLPMLGEYELYNEFHIDEPWDSEHNKALIAKMPEFYVTPGTTDDGTTSLHVFVGEHAFANDKGLKIRDIIDGTSNTLLVVQAGANKADVWTKPGGLKADAENPLDELGSLEGETFFALFGDGQVTAIKKDVPIETLKALITKDGGEIIDYDSF